MARKAILAVLMALLAGAQARTLLQTMAPTSSMWGVNGSSYKPTKDGGRLLDWSYAGYNAGEGPLPSPPVTHELKNFGAKGDGITDDTPAFVSAFNVMMASAACNPRTPCVLRIPCGKYIIKQTLRVIGRSIIFRGEGSNCTQLLVPNPPGDASVFQFYGRLVEDNQKITGITATAKKGTNIIKVASSSNLVVGKWFVVTMGAPTGGDLFLPLNLGLDKGCTDLGFCNGATAFIHFTRVARIIDATTIQIERPLPWDLFSTFNPKAIYAFKPRTNNGGVEGVAIHMLSPRYLGHFLETGYNAIKIDGAVNHFVRDVRIYDADVGVAIRNSAFTTVNGIVLYGTAARECVVNGKECQLNETGHTGIWSSGSDNLITNFWLKTRFVHDISVNKFAHNTVYSDGKGVMIDMDHHKGHSTGILWTNINVGICQRPFSHGGCPGCGLAAGPHTTFWNVACGSPAAPTPLEGTQLTRPYPDLGVLLNFVGNLRNFPTTPLNALQRSWVKESVDFRGYNAINLHAAQVAVRLASPNKVSPLLGGVGNGGKTLMESWLM